MTRPKPEPRAPPRLDLALERLAKDLCVGPFSCRGVRPTREGDLRFRVSLPGLELRLSLSARGAARDSGCVGEIGGLRLHAPDGLAEDGARRLAAIAARRLAWVLRQDQGEWLKRRNREHREIAPLPGPFLGLLAELLAVDAPFWGKWRLAGARGSKDRPGRIFLDLSQGPPADAAARRATLAVDPGGPASAGETALAATPLGWLLRCPGPAGEVSEPGAEAEGAVALALSLALHAGMRWGAPSRSPEPAEPSPGAGPGGLGSDDTLVEYCFRSVRGWDMRASRFFGTWGDRDFFQILAVAGLKRVMVSHTVRDCPVTVSALTGVLDHGPNPYHTRPRHFAGDLRSSRCTDLDDTTVIFGGEARLEEVARSAAREAGTAATQVHFGCDYHMIGDDAAGVCRRLRDEGLRVELMNPPLPRFTDESSSDWWKTVLAPACPPPEKRDRFAVNLAGLAWPDDPCLAELAGLLGKFGVSVQARFFPGGAAMERQALAALTVASPWTPVARVLSPLLGERSFPMISPPAPYGVRGTQAWLETVLAAVGAPAPDPGACEGWMDEAFPRRRELREAAGAVTVGLVADFGTAREMCDPAFFFGLDPTAFLLDLGFRVHVLAPGADAARAGLPALPPEWLKRLSATELSRGADPLEAAADLGLRLVYCDAPLTLPLKERGLTPWSIDDLHPGLGGAEKSLRRLLNLARRRLYADYGGHLRTPG